MQSPPKEEVLQFHPSVMPVAKCDCNCWRFTSQSERNPMSFLTTLASAFKGGGGARVPVSRGFVSPWATAFDAGAPRAPFEYSGARWRMLAGDCPGERSMGGAWRATGVLPGRAMALYRTSRWIARARPIEWPDHMLSWRLETCVRTRSTDRRSGRRQRSARLNWSIDRRIETNWNFPGKLTGTAWPAWRLLRVRREIAGIFVARMP